MLDQPQRDAVRRAAEIRRFEPGAVLIQEGDPSSSVLVVISGRVKIVATAAGGHNAVLAVREPGDILGEMAALDGNTRSATAIALDQVTTLWISAARFVHVVREHEGVATALLMIITARLRYATARRSEVGGRSTAGRIAIVLTDLAERYGVPTSDGVRIALRISQQDIGGLASASHEAVGRVLRTLRQEGVISTGSQEMTIHRPDVLRRLCGDWG
jgi:CRP-like cAMP-binding protein